MVERDSEGKFLPGSVANPGGRPKGCSKALQDIENTIEEFEKEKGVSYWKAATLIAMRLADKGNTTLLCKLLDKFVSSKIDIEGESLLKSVININSNGKTQPFLNRLEHKSETISRDLSL